jgi:uncharacterized protein YndB with AHSA1/START domain
MKTKIELEYLFRSNPSFLFPWFTDPVKLSAWYAEKVTCEDKLYSFFWGNEEYQATIEKQEKQNYIRYQWLKENDYYLEFKFSKSDFSEEVSLNITDFEAEGEHEEMIQLWNFHIEQLRAATGL